MQLSCQFARKPSRCLLSVYCRDLPWCLLQIFVKAVVWLLLCQRASSMSSAVSPTSIHLSICPVSLPESLRVLHSIPYKYLFIKHLSCQFAREQNIFKCPAISMPESLCCLLYKYFLENLSLVSIFSLSCTGKLHSRQLKYKTKSAIGIYGFYKQTRK